jgi:hypothetical protein
MSVSYKFSIPRVEKIQEISGKESVISKLTYAVQAQSTVNFENTILLTKNLELDYTSLDPFVNFEELTFEQLVEWILEDQSVTSIEEIDIVVEAISKIKSKDFEIENKTVKTETSVSLGVYRSIAE